MKITGKYNTAIVYNDRIDEESLRQIREFCNQEIFSRTNIRIMPDVHAGMGCVIGYTANLEEKLVPNLIGLDIGCGIHACLIGKVDISYESIDKFIRQNIPSGFKRNKEADPEHFEPGFIKDLENTCSELSIDFDEHLKAIGSLGGGNHFIEIATDSSGNKWLLIHSGSRNFGLQVATWHQKKAISNCMNKGIDIPKDFAFLETGDRDHYIRHMKVAQRYAELNRREIADRISGYLKTGKPEDAFESVHNYINFQDRIIRKGAISAKDGERMIIPLNMKDGSLLAVGKGNPEWNCSAPHGAGRRMSRNQAKKLLDMKDFVKSMKNVWTSSISEKTLDEAPRAYKPKGEILQHLGETAEITDQLKPEYNFKAQ